MLAGQRLDRSPSLDQPARGKRDGRAQQQRREPGREQRDAAGVANRAPRARCRDPRGRIPARGRTVDSRRAAHGRRDELGAELWQAAAAGAHDAPSMRARSVRRPRLTRWRSDALRAVELARQLGVVAFAEDAAADRLALVDRQLSQ